MKVRDLPPHDPLTIIEDQEHRLVWIEPEDPDDLWDPRLGAFVPRPSGLWALMVGLIAGAIVGLALGLAIAGAVSAAPRSAQTTERFDLSPPSSAGPIGAPRSGTAVEAAAEATREAPAPAGGVGAPLHGIASWYGASGLIAAAGPGLRTGHWRETDVIVTANGRSVRVRLADWCACPARLIDLSDDAFRRLAPLSVGLVRVTVTRAGPMATPPPTDVGP